MDRLTTWVNCYTQSIPPRPAAEQAKQGGFGHNNNSDKEVLIADEWRWVILCGVGNRNAF